MFGPKDQCLHPQTEKSYIKSSIGERGNSPEGLQVKPIPWTSWSGVQIIVKFMNKRGITYVFLSEFDDEDNLEKGPAHLSIVQSLEGADATLQVVDFNLKVF